MRLVIRAACVSENQFQEAVIAWNLVKDSRRLTAKKVIVERTFNVIDSLTTPELVQNSRHKGLVINEDEIDPSRATRSRRRTSTTSETT